MELPSGASPPTGSLTGTPLRSVRSVVRKASSDDVGGVTQKGAARSKASPPTEKEEHFMLRRMFANEDSCLFHPHSHSVQSWNALVALLLVIQAVVLPLQLAFASDEMLTEFTSLVWFNVWGDMVLWLDILLQCFLQVQSPDRSHWIRGTRAIAWRYFKKEFLIDVCGLLPLRYFIVQLVPLLPSGPPAWLPEISHNDVQCSLSLLGFHKLLRFSRFLRVFRSLQAHEITSYLQFTYQQQRLAQSALTVAFTCHVMGCLWATLAVCMHGESGSWLHFIKALKGNAEHLYDPDNFFAIYTCSLYWAVFTITGVGYGDIVPVSAIEYIMASICMLFSALVWAWVIANIVSIMATMNEATNEHLQTLDCINELLAEFGSDKANLGRRLREYFTKIRDVKEYDVISGVIHRLSPALKLEVVHAIHDVWISEVWWLSKVPNNSEFMVELTLRMTTRLHAPNELIPNKQELCVVLQGLCIHGGCLRSKGQTFGEDMLLNNEALRKPFATLAMTYLHLFVLTRRILNSLVIKYPEAAIVIRRSYVQFAVIRGILFKAERHKRRQQLANPKIKSAMSALDRSYSHKPMGDAEDVLVSPANRLSIVEDPWSTNLNDETAAMGSSATLRSSSSLYGRSQSRRMSNVSNFGLATEALESELPATAADLLVGVGGVVSDDNGFASQEGGITVEELNAFTKSRDDVSSRLRERASTLEAAAARLLEQVEILNDY